MQLWRFLEQFCGLVQLVGPCDTLSIDDAVNGFVLHRRFFTDQHAK